MLVPNYLLTSSIYETRFKIELCFILQNFLKKISAGRSFVKFDS